MVGLVDKLGASLTTFSIFDEKIPAAFDRPFFDFCSRQEHLELLDKMDIANWEQL